MRGGDASDAPGAAVTATRRVIHSPYERTGAYEYAVQLHTHTTNSDGAGFNTWYQKIQPRGSAQIDLSDPAQFQRVAELAQACAERGLALVAYTYHYPHGHRNPQRYGSFVLEHPPLVLADGTVLEDRFPIANEDTWRLITSAVFELARASRQLPIAAVGFDHEHFGRGTISYDDAAWADFANEQGLDPSLAPEVRGPSVREQELRPVYERWYHERWDRIVKQWVERIHEINPHLSIAMMPQNGRKNWFGKPFFRHAGTAQAPAIMDCWHMYNGSGLTEAVLQPYTNPGIQPAQPACPVVSARQLPDQRPSRASLPRTVAAGRLLELARGSDHRCGGSRGLLAGVWGSESRRLPRVC